MHTVSITIAGAVMTGKTAMAGAIVKVLQDAGIQVSLDDSNDMPLPDTVAYADKCIKYVGEKTQVVISVRQQRDITIPERVGSGVEIEEDFSKLSLSAQCAAVAILAEHEVDSVNAYRYWSQNTTDTRAFLTVQNGVRALATKALFEKWVATQTYKDLKHKIAQVHFC